MKKLLAMLVLLAVLLLAATALAECHHTYDMVDVKKVTCETDGYSILKCNDCGHTVKEIANAQAVAWQAELNRLYQLWLDNCEPEDQPMVINHKVMFEGHLNSQITLWNAQYGEGSLMVLRLVNETMEEQCCTLCPVVYALTPTG